MTPRTTRSMRGLTTDEIIRALRDGSRDMTTVIFRQVPQMDIFAPNGGLYGQPLYRVNFCPAPVSRHGGRHDACLTFDSTYYIPNHEHVLWVIEDRLLYRCRVPNNYNCWSGEEEGAKLRAAWSKSQEKILACPQLYLTGLNR